MKRNIFYPKIYYLIIKKDRGFTLIELLIIAIIIGILSAISLPNFIGQIGKAKETEAKISLGSIAHTQQAYHFETKSFYNGDINNFSSLSLSGRYYIFTSDTTADGNKAIHSAYASNPSDSGARDFSLGIYYSAAKYNQTLCIANKIDNDGTTSSVVALADTSCDGGNKIR